MGIDEDGNPIVKYGVEFIEDIDLLKEMQNWYKGGNFDRITAFSHALVYARELDKLNVLPEKQNKKKELTQNDLRKRELLLGTNRYGMTRGKKY
jgi:hypothetical protein